jgi:hypothetical protein
LTAETDLVPALGGAARIRRAQPLVATWNDGRFGLENYLTGKWTIVVIPVLQVLDALDEYVHVDEIRRRFDIPGPLDGLQVTLHDRDLFVTEGLRRDEGRPAGLDLALAPRRAEFRLHHQR